MIESVMIDRQTGSGKYADVLDAAEKLGDGDYGSAANALAVMARQSRLFSEYLKRRERETQGDTAAA